MRVAGVDVGGTNIGVGLIDDGYEVVSRAKGETPTAGVEAVLDAIAAAVDDLDERPDAVGVGVPGPVADGSVTSLPNVSWEGEVDLGSEVAARLGGLPVVVGNDVHLGLLGEWVAGAARDARFVLGVWLGTGVGGGLVLDGKPYSGATGASGEFGHLIVHHGGALCYCGRRGCVEAYAGRRAMTHAVEVAVGAGRPTALLDIQRDKGKDRLTSSVWAKALDEGDELARELIDTAVEMVGVGVGGVLNLLDVDLVVVGGGLAEKLGQQLADDIEEAAAPWVLRPRDDRRFLAAALGDDSGIVGGAALARAELLHG